MTSAGDRDGRRFKLTDSDFVDPSTSRVVDQLKAAQSIPLVRNVGEVRKSNDGYLTLLWTALGGLSGGVLVWILWNIIPTPDDVTANNLQASVFLALGLVFVIVAVDSGRTRSWAKVGRAYLIAVPVALVTALLFGGLANAFYGGWTESLFDDLLSSGFDPSTDAFWEQFYSRNNLGRGIAWAIIGIAAGLSVGVTSLSVKRTLVTSAGGLAGGFLGGFLFDFFTGEGEAQIVGLAVTGLVVGLAIGLMEQATKTSWLEIVQGGMAGKQFILYKPQITVGSSPAADVTLIKDPAIPPIAATLSRRGPVVTITSGDSLRPVVVDDAAIVSTTLREGALISVGTTVVRYRERNAKEVSASIVRS